MAFNPADDWARKSKMKSVGMFSTPSYWGVGEPFDDSVKSAPRRTLRHVAWSGLSHALLRARTGARVGAQGLQMVTNKQRLGITGDNWNNNKGKRTGFKRLCATTC